jgi:hypothetical protein
MAAARRGSRRGAIAIPLGALLAAACSGGGSQLAQQGQPAASTTAGASAATSAATGSSSTSPPSATIDSTPRPSSPAHPPVPTSELASPKTPEAAARELRRVETALRGDDRDPARLERLGRRQQLAYRALSAHPAWRTAVEAAMPVDLRTAVQANLDAGAALGSLTGTGDELPSSLPDWKVLAPQAAPTLRGYYEEGEAATRIPWAYLAAIHFVESRVGRIHGPSGAGAQGPMQFIPSTWEAYGTGDINDDHDAILAAGRYLADTGGPGDMARALAAYNHDDRYVAAVDAYAKVMLADPRAYDGYHAWQVFFATRDATFLLPEGFGT